MRLDPLAPVRLGFRIGIAVLRFELQIIEELLGLDTQPEPAAPAEWRMPAGTARQPASQAAPRAPVPPPRASARAPVPAPAPAGPADESSPAHIEDEPELVAEFADPGAEEGAGPELHVDEPWDGYARMNAADVRERIAVAGAAEVAVVQL